MARPSWMSTAAWHRLQPRRDSEAELQDPGSHLTRPETDPERQAPGPLERCLTGDGDADMPGSSPSPSAVLSNICQQVRKLPRTQSPPSTGAAWRTGDVGAPSAAAACSAGDVGAPSSVSHRSSLWATRGLGSPSRLGAHPRGLSRAVT